jgi:hypothetical protein
MDPLYNKKKSKSPPTLLYSEKININNSIFQKRVSYTQQYVLELMIIFTIGPLPLKSTKITIPVPLCLIIFDICLHLYVYLYLGDEMISMYKVKL